MVDEDIVKRFENIKADKDSKFQNFAAVRVRDDLRHSRYIVCVVRDASLEAVNGGLQKALSGRWNAFVIFDAKKESPSPGVGKCNAISS